jgi:hypothetical protein
MLKLSATCRETKKDVKVLTQKPKIGEKLIYEGKTYTVQYVGAHLLVFTDQEGREDLILWQIDGKFNSRLFQAN